MEEELEKERVVGRRLNAVRGHVRIRDASGGGKGLTARIAHG